MASLATPTEPIEAPAQEGKKQKRKRKQSPVICTADSEGEFKLTTFN